MRCGFSYSYEEFKASDREERLKELDEDFDDEFDSDTQEKEK